MVAIARLAHGLLPQMPEPLMITQLIFVHSAPIDISFRKDERRFDVEGGYNIRYEVVKKRIDKVRVRDTGERLTQPGKIAIIYFNDREAEEYEGYIRYLEEKEMLNGEIERLRAGGIARGQRTDGVTGGCTLVKGGIDTGNVRPAYYNDVIGLHGGMCCGAPGGASGGDVPSPHGYDLGSPKKFVMSESLREISGIVLLRNNPDTVYAIEDETGRLYYFHLGDHRWPSYKFGGHGDYEDVTILDDSEFVVLRSDGSLFVFPVGLIHGGDNKAVRVYEHILPPGEYEGLFGDAGGRLVALCKNCPQDDQRVEVSGYLLQYDRNRALSITDHFLVEVPKEKLTSIHRKIKFHPSAVARHPLTKEWYIISSVNKVLIVLDDRWKVKGMYALNPELFKQPEGLAFDGRGNMYISNEGQQGNANVLLFAYKP